MNTSPTLSTLLGHDLPCVRKIEKYLNKLVTEEANDDDNDIDLYTTYVIEGLVKLLQLDANGFNMLQKIDLPKRSAFFDAIKDRFDNVNEKISRHVEIDKLNKLNKELLPILHDLCYFDFSRHRLSFASVALEQLSALEQYEQELLEKIEQLRDDSRLNHVLNTQYNELKNSRRKIVIAVMGCMKSAKSSFINYLLQEKVCPVDDLSSTARITRIIYGTQRKVYLDGEEGEEIDDIASLYIKATELIALQGNDRNDAAKCKMTVVIELPIDQLKNIELWDFPGLTENPVLDDIVLKILVDVDLVFALLPIGGVPFDFIKIIQKYLTQNRTASNVVNETLGDDINVARFRQQVCFVITKIDSVALNSQAGETRDSKLQRQCTIIIERMKSELQVDINLGGANVLSSSRFIFMCTESKHVMDFLNCQEKFYNKSATFFKASVNDITRLRLDYLLQAIYELLDYDDIDRTTNICEQLISIINERRQNLEDNFKTELNICFKPIRQQLYSQIAILSKKWSTFGILSWNRRDWSAVVETIMKTSEMSMETHSAGIRQSATEAIDNLFLTLDLHPNQEQVVKQAINRTFLENPYRIIIGQHEIESAPNRATKLAWSQAESEPGSQISKIFSRCLTPFRFLNNLRKATRETLTNMTESNVQKVVDQCFDNTIREISLSIEGQVGTLLDQIKAKQKTMLRAQNTEEADVVAKFISNNEQSITKLYLNIQHEKSCAEYGVFEMSNEQPGSSNFFVYAALLATDHHSEKIPIAAKQVNLQEFCSQEVRYIDNNHQNIVKLYGVRRSNTNDDYYILMEKLDCNLSKYLLENKNNLVDSDIDKMIMQIVNGLHYLHNLNLIHRNIKPANIFVRKCQAPVFLINGFSFLHESSCSIEDTPCYMAPELTNTDSRANDSPQLMVDRFVCSYASNNLLTAKTDIYALGVTITEIYKKLDIVLYGQYHRFWSSVAYRCLSRSCGKRPTCTQILAKRRNCVEEAEVAPIVASNKTLSPAQKTVELCGGNACIHCDKCCDWHYDGDVDHDWKRYNRANNCDVIFDRKRWRRDPNAKCFFGYHHFAPYYHHRDDDSARFYIHFSNRRDRDADSFHEDYSRFYAHFHAICKCIRH